MITSSPNPVGSGARAAGMAGAFIAVADDATAASWNPGGLIQLEKPEMSLVGAFFKRFEDTCYDSFPESSGSLDTSGKNLNYLSLAYPFRAYERNATVSLNYQHMFNFDKEQVLSFSRDYSTYSSKYLYRLNQKGDLFTFSPAGAVQLTPYLSLGFTINFWEDFIHDNTWQADYSEQIEVQRTSGSFLSRVEHSDQYDFSGMNFHFGFLWDINRIFTLGGVFKSEFEADLSHTHYYSSCQDTVQTNTVTLSDEKMNMPMSYGMGLSARLSDALSFGVDIYRTHWQDYYIVTSDGRKISPVSGKETGDTDISPTTQVRLGMEYLFILEKTVIPLRCGVFYDPEPSDGTPDDFFGITLGSGVLYKNLVFDLSYQYRFGHDVREVELGGSSSSMDVEEHQIFFSLIIYLHGINKAG